MKIASLPFLIDRNLATSLVDQVVAGMRSAIDAGVYPAGGEVPSLRDLAAGLGVSLIVVREAYSRLADAGVLAMRRGSGCRVVGAEGRVWRGQVLVVGFGHGEHFVSNAIQAELRSCFQEAGYLVTCVQAHVSTGGFDGCHQLESVLRCRYDLIVSLCDERPVLSRLRKTGSPVVLFHNRRMRLPRQVPDVFFDDRAAVPEMVGHCRSVGIRSVVEVGINPEFATALPALKAAGIAAERWVIPPLRNEPGVIARTSERTQAYFAERLASRNFALPDLFYFTDDHVATAALMALLYRGVRIPEDAKAVTWCNRGLGPTFPVPLTRMEFDPYAAGRRIFETAEAVLAGSVPPDKTNVGPCYIPGMTFDNQTRQWR